MKIPNFFLILCLLFPVFASAWDADDETFDPTVFETIIDGASRLGDPSPFIREGYEERGFTHVGFTKQEVSAQSTVNLTFILMPRDDDPAKTLGGSLFISSKTATKLSEALVKGDELTRAHTITEGGWMGDWTLVYDAAKGMVFKQAKDGLEAQFILSVPAAKKLAGALEHSIASLAAAE